MKKTNKFRIGDRVLVADPEGIDELYDHSFEGIIFAFKDKYIAIRDVNGETFTIDPKNCQVID